MLVAASDYRGWERVHHFEDEEDARAYIRHRGDVHARRRMARSEIRLAIHCPAPRTPRGNETRAIGHDPNATCANFLHTDRCAPITTRAIATSVFRQTREI